jgi:DNA polymerase epsilon subunit 3
MPSRKSDQRKSDATAARFALVEDVAAEESPSQTTPQPVEEPPVQTPAQTPAGQTEKKDKEKEKDKDKEKGTKTTRMPLPSKYAKDLRAHHTRDDR